MRPKDRDDEQFGRISSGVMHTRSENLITWFARNPIAANLLMIVIAIGGINSFLDIRKEVMPRLDLRQIEIRLLYPGAGPEETEKALCIPVEDAVNTLPGIKRLDSEAVEGECRVVLRLKPGNAPQAVLSAVRAKVQDIRTLPKQLEKVEIQELRADWEAINVMLSGAVDPLSLKRQGQRIRDDLMHIPGVSHVADYNETMAYEISVHVSIEKLKRYRLTLGEVAEAVRNASLDLPSGMVRTSAGEILVRAKGRAEQIPDFAGLVVRTQPDGSRLMLGDVAEIKDGLVETPFENRFDGVLTEGWEVYAEEDAIDVARRVKEYVSDASIKLQEGVRLSTWWDNSIMFEERMQTLLEDGLAGFALVFLVLMLFLRTDVAFWAGIGILTSLLGALWLMPTFAVSLNMFSLFGFLLAMGILVDDAIIVSERIHTWQTNGLTGLAGVIRGTQEVATPVIIAVLTTLVAFLPGLPLSGWAGQMMHPICVVMILTIMFSLAEALLILPSHLSHQVRPRPDSQFLDTIRAHLNRVLQNFVNRIYQPCLALALNWRFLIVAGFLVIILLSASLILAGQVRLSLQADITRDAFRVNLSVPPGTAFNETRSLAERVEKALFELRDDLQRARPDEQSVVSHLETNILANEVIFFVEFSPDARQRYSIDDLVQSWRRRIGDLGHARIDFLYRQARSPYDIVIEASSPDGDIVATAAEELKRRLVRYPGVFDVVDSRELGKPEIRFQLRPEGERFGVRLRDIAEQVRQGFHGEEVQRFQRDEGEIKVFVRLPLDDRTSPDRLLAMPIRLPGGGLAPLGSLAEIRFVPGYTKLVREDRRRMLQVKARVDQKLVDANAIYGDLERETLRILRERHPTLRVEVGQERQDQESMAAELSRNTVLAILVIYTLIAVPFRSYAKPLIFLLAAPVAWSGAIFAHWLFRLPLSLESLVGMIAASGVVVNDSLVLLDSIQEQSPSNKPVGELIGYACTSRFRPIFLAFLTNFAGFLPTLLETSAQAQFLVPMTLSLSAGLLVGMSASLLLTPVCYAILEETRKREKCF